MGSCWGACHFHVSLYLSPLDWKVGVITLPLCLFYILISDMTPWLLIGARSLWWTAAGTTEAESAFNLKTAFLSRGNGFVITMSQQFTHQGVIPGEIMEYLFGKQCEMAADCRDAYRCTYGWTTVGDCISQKGFLRLNNRPTGIPSFHQVLKIWWCAFQFDASSWFLTGSGRAAWHAVLRRISSRFHCTWKDPCADVDTEEAEPRVRLPMACSLETIPPFFFIFTLSTSLIFRPLTAPPSLSI